MAVTVAGDRWWVGCGQPGSGGVGWGAVGRRFPGCWEGFPAGLGTGWYRQPKRLCSGLLDLAGVAAGDGSAAGGGRLRAWLEPAGRRGPAWVLWAASLALVAATGTLAVAVGPLSASAGLVPAVFSVIFATVGAVVESCRPGHLVGRLYLLMGLLAGVQGLGDQYVAATPRLPAAALLGWVSSWIWLAWAGVGLTLLLLTFPTGRLPGPRWRLVGWLAVAGALAAAVGFALTPGPLPSYPAVANPFSIAGAQPALGMIIGVGNLLCGEALLAAAGSLVVRFRRSRGDRRSS